MASMQLELDNIDIIKMQFEREKEEIKEQWTTDTQNHKREINDFRTKLRRVTQEMSKTNYTNGKILKQMALDTGTTEPKTQGTQTGKSLISLKFIKSLNFTEMGTDARNDEDESGINLATKILSKKASIANSVTTSQLEKGDWLKYSRETIGLGKKGANMVNVYTQCDIKIAAAHYRAIQRQCIDYRLENDKLKQNEEMMQKRIERLIKEKEEVMVAFRKI